MRRLQGLLLALFLLAPTVLPAPTRAQELSEDRRVAIAERLSEATVQIRVGREAGSGFFATDDGLVVTNAHVVRGAGRNPVIVVVGAGDSRRARVVAYDQALDLAVLQVEGTPVRPLPLGDPDRVRVGQTVLAFGSPFGLAGTLTQGIVSARRDLGGGRIQGVIQTDAPINPGNSGGPLTNSRGEVIGVNTAILSRSGGSNGIGFAVPSNYVRQIIAQAKQHLAQRRTDGPAPRVAARDAAPAASPVWLGVIATSFEGQGGGVQVYRVYPGGPAADAGLRGAEDGAPSLVRRLGIRWTGHIITAVDGNPINDMSDLYEALKDRRPGQRARLTVTVGPGAVEGEATVVLEAPPREVR